MKLDVAPFGGAFSRTGDARISSRVGIGKLFGRVRVRWVQYNEWYSSPILSADLARGACLCAHLCAEGLYLIDNEALHALDRVFFLKAEVERLHKYVGPPQTTAMERQTYGGADGLVRGIVPHGKVRMVQCLLTRDALRGVEVEELAEQIDREGICAREERLEGHTRLNRQRTDVILGLW